MKKDSMKETEELRNFLESFDECLEEERYNNSKKVNFSYSSEDLRSHANDLPMEKLYENIKEAIKEPIDNALKKNNDQEQDDFYETTVAKEMEKLTKFSAQKCFEKGIKVPFHTALSFLQVGFAITRVCWEDDLRVVYMVPGSHFQATRFPLSDLVFTGESVEYLPHIDMIYLNDNTAKTWAPSNEDLFAKDWMVFCNLNKEE